MKMRLKVSGMAAVLSRPQFVKVAAAIPLFFRTPVSEMDLWAPFVIMD